MAYSDDSLSYISNIRVPRSVTDSERRLRSSIDSVFDERSSAFRTNYENTEASQGSSVLSGFATLGAGILGLIAAPFTGGASLAVTGASLGAAGYGGYKFIKSSLDQRNVSKVYRRQRSNLRIQREATRKKTEAGIDIYRNNYKSAILNARTQLKNLEVNLDRQALAIETNYQRQVLQIDTQRAGHRYQLGLLDLGREVLKQTSALALRQANDKYITAYNLFKIKKEALSGYKEAAIHGYSTGQKFAGLEYRAGIASTLSKAVGIKGSETLEEEANRKMESVGVTLASFNLAQDTAFQQRYAESLKLESALLKISEQNLLNLEGLSDAGRELSTSKERIRVEYESKVKQIDRKENYFNSLLGLLDRKEIVEFNNRDRSISLLDRAYDIAERSFDKRSDLLLEQTNARIRDLEANAYSRINLPQFQPIDIDLDFLKTPIDIGTRIYTQSLYREEARKQSVPEFPQLPQISSFESDFTIGGNYGYIG